VGDLGVTEAADGVWDGRRVLLTGAAGFLGGWTARALLATGASVHGLDIDWDGPRSIGAPEGLTVVHGDVRDPASMRRVLADTNADTVIHLAAQTLVGPALANPVDTFQHNIEGTWMVLEACRGAPTVRRIVVASSDKAYGDAGGRPYREDMALRAVHPYDASKAAADILARTYAHTYALPVAVSRCGNLYGGGDLNWSRIVPGTIRSVLSGERPVIRSNGSLVRDYLHVRDAARGVLRLADAVGAREDLRGAALNFSGGYRASVIQVVEQILDLMDSNLEPEILGTARFEIAEQRVSSARARRELSWRPEVRFVDGLRETIDSYRALLEAGR
jgi:CDP-glucose 4,6-dehydratase